MTATTLIGKTLMHYGFGTTPAILDQMTAGSRIKPGTWLLNRSKKLQYGVMLGIETGVSLLFFDGKEMYKEVALSPVEAVIGLGGVLTVQKAVNYRAAQRRRKADREHLAAIRAKARAEGRSIDDVLTEVSAQADENAGTEAGRRLLDTLAGYQRASQEETQGTHRRPLSSYLPSLRRKAKTPQEEVADAQRRLGQYAPDENLKDKLKGY